MPPWRVILQHFAPVYDESQGCRCHYFGLKYAFLRTEPQNRTWFWLIASEALTCNTSPRGLPHPPYVEDNRTQLPKKLRLWNQTQVRYINFDKS